MDDNADHSVSIDIADLLPGSPITSELLRSISPASATARTGPSRRTAHRGSNRLQPPASTQHGAHIDVQIKPGFEPTTFHIEYGDAGYGNSTAESGVIGADGNNHGASVDLTGLTSGYAYHYRVVASNGVGTTTGVDHTFTTVPEPAAVAAPPSVTCKKGFAKRHGKCVKKPRRHKKSRHRARG